MRPGNAELDMDAPVAGRRSRCGGRNWKNPRTSSQEPPRSSIRRPQSGPPMQCASTHSSRGARARRAARTKPAGVDHQAAPCSRTSPPHLSGYAIRTAPADVVPPQVRRWPGPAGATYSHACYRINRRYASSVFHDSLPHIRLRVVPAHADASGGAPDPRTRHAERHLPACGPDRRCTHPTPRTSPRTLPRRTDDREVPTGTRRDHPRARRAVTRAGEVLAAQPLPHQELQRIHVRRRPVGGGEDLARAAPRDPRNGSRVRIASGPARAASTRGHPPMDASAARVRATRKPRLKFR